MKRLLYLLVLLLAACGKEEDMAVFDIVPGAFTSIDIRDTLNANGGSVGDFSGDYFSEKAKVNPLAKYKPVRYPVWFASPGQYWQAIDGNCGIRFPKVTNPPAASIPFERWGHDFPHGGDQEPMRITDYAGYNPKARELLTIIYPSQDVDPGERYYVTVRMNPSAEFSIRDVWQFNQGNQAHFGLILRNTFNKELRFVTAAYSVTGASEWTISIALPANWQSGSVLDAYVVIAPQSQSYESNNVPFLVGSLNQNDYCTGYNGNIKIAEPALQVTLSITINQDNYNSGVGYTWKYSIYAVKGDYDKSKFRLQWSGTNVESGNIQIPGSGTLSQGQFLSANGPGYISLFDTDSNGRANFNLYYDNTLIATQSQPIMRPMQ